MMCPICGVETWMNNHSHMLGRYCVFYWYSEFDNSVLTEVDLYSEGGAWIKTVLRFDKLMALDEERIEKLLVLA
jgi:hypothetical protein